MTCKGVVNCHICANAEEVAQAYRSSYSSVSSSGNICYEIGVMRFLCNK